MREIKSQEDLEKYDRAIRIAEEEAEQRECGTWVSKANFTLSKKAFFPSIKEKMNEYFNVLQSYLRGEIKEPAIIHQIDERRYECWPLYYFEFPEFFENDISTLDDCYGDLSETDLAWIKNARELIRKYHAIVYEKKQESQLLKGEEKYERCNSY